MKTTVKLFVAALLLTRAHNAIASVRYVDVNSINPMPPYTSWATAATNIQDAVDAGVTGDVVLVTNGVYQTGGKGVSALVSGMNRLAVTKALAIQSVNGPAVTVISALQIFSAFVIRCVCLTNGASLSGFTLADGTSNESAGGVWCQSTNVLVTNCVITGNSCEGHGGGIFRGTLVNCSLTANFAKDGGGAFQSLLRNCTLTRNVANGGGGTYDSKLYNCTVTGNSAQMGGGGVLGGTCRNCIVYDNSALSYANYGSNATFSYSCTMPLPTSGSGNFTNAPSFVDQASGNLRLQSNSPCINSGDNAYAPADLDLDGNPRIAGGTVDIGAYELQAPVSKISYAWLQQYGLPINASTDTSDPDGDGMNNWQEWRCLTDPTNALSALRLLAPVTTGTNIAVTWQSVTGVNYFLERSTSLAVPAPFTSLATNIPAYSLTTSFTDTNAIGGGPFFYRVGVGD